MRANSFELAPRPTRELAWGGFEQLGCGVDQSHLRFGERLAKLRRGFHSDGTAPCHDDPARLLEPIVRRLDLGRALLIRRRFRFQQRVKIPRPGRDHGIVEVNVLLDAVDRDGHAAVRNSDCSALHMTRAGQEARVIHAGGQLRRSDEQSWQGHRHFPIGLGIDQGHVERIAQVVRDLVTSRSAADHYESFPGHCSAPLLGARKALAR